MAVGVVVRVEAAFDLAPVHKLDTLFVRWAVPDVALNRHHQVLALVVGPRGQEVHVGKDLVVILCTEVGEVGFGLVQYTLELGPLGLAQLGCIR